MKNYDLRSMWQTAHDENQGNKYDHININELGDRNHSQMITKVITDVKWGIFTNSMALILLASLLIYALGYLRLHLQAYSLVPFLGTGIFFLIQACTAILRFNILTRPVENLTVKESLLIFRRKVIHMKTFDFLSYLIFFYLLAIWTIYLHLKDIGGIQNLDKGNEIQPLVIVLVLLLLMLPWFIKYMYNQRYKKLFTNLNRSAIDLEEV